MSLSSRLVSSSQPLDSTSRHDALSGPEGSPSNAATGGIPAQYVHLEPDEISTADRLDDSSPTGIDPAAWLVTMGFGFEESENSPALPTTLAEVEGQKGYRGLTKVIWLVVAAIALAGGMKGYEKYKEQQCIASTRLVGSICD
jgi:hypothetical protein